MFSLDSVGFLITDFNLFYVLSEIANYIYILIILVFLTSFKLLDKDYFIFWAFYFATPLLVNYILFHPSYMGDQFQYAAAVNDFISEGYSSLSGFATRITGGQLMMASAIMSFVPMVSYLSVTSIGFINKLIALVLLLFLSRKIDQKNLMYFFIVPSFILYSSVGLRDVLIMVSITFFLFSLVERKFLTSLFFALIVLFIKIQLGLGLFISWALMFIIRADISIIRLQIGALIAVAAAIFLFDSYGELLNIYRYAFALEDCPGQYASCTTIGPEDFRINSGIDLIWLVITSVPLFLLKPLPWEISGFFQLLTFIEVCVLYYFFYVFAIKSKLYFSNTFWIVITSFAISTAVFAITSFNLGTLSRYRFEMLWPYLMVIYFLYIKHESSKEPEAA